MNETNEHKPDAWAYSSDGEVFYGRFSSPEEAAANALFGSPSLEAVEVGRLVRYHASHYVSGQAIIMDVWERARDIAGEAADDWLAGLEYRQEAMEELERLVGDWLEAQEPALFERVLDVRTVARAELAAAGILTDE